METTVVSVIMPCFNEAHFLRTALDSILAQTFPRDQMEVLIVDGGSSDGSSSIVDEYEGVIIRLLLLDNPRQHIAAALNIGLEAAHGDFVVRMDAHTVYAADYVERCVEGLRRDVAEAVGGCQQGRGLGFWGRTIAIATQHLFGSGGPAYKASSRPGYVDTVYLGAWRRDTLRALGGWREEWEINEDYELFYRLRARGGRVFLDPAIRSRYWVRPSLRALARQYYRYGLWRVKTLVEHPASARPRHFANPCLLASLALGVSLLPWVPQVLTIEVAGYLVALVLAAIHAAGHANVVLPFFGLLVTFPVIHLSWALGFVRGATHFGWPLRAAQQTLRQIVSFPGCPRSSGAYHPDEGAQRWVITWEQ